MPPRLPIFSGPSAHAEKFQALRDDPESLGHSRRALPFRPCRDAQPPRNRVLTQGMLQNSHAQRLPHQLAPATHLPPATFRRLDEGALAGDAQKACFRPVPWPQRFSAALGSRPFLRRFPIRFPASGRFLPDRANLNGTFPISLKSFPMNALNALHRLSYPEAVKVMS